MLPQLLFLKVLGADEPCIALHLPIQGVLHQCERLLVGPVVAATLNLGSRRLLPTALIVGVLLSAVRTVQAHTVVILWLDVVGLRLLGKFFALVELAEVTVQLFEQLVHGHLTDHGKPADSSELKQFLLGFFMNSFDVSFQTILIPQYLAT